MPSIVDIVTQAGLELTQIGDGMYRSFCPFHDDKNTPNFTVYEKTNDCHCFSCNWHGDIIKFLSEFYKISREEAMTKMAFDDDWIKSQLIQQKKEDNTSYVLVYARKIRELLKQYPDKYIYIIKALKGFDNLNIVEKYQQIQKICTEVENG